MHKEAAVMKSTLDFLVALRPFAFVLENVKGILTCSAQESKAPSDLIISKMEAAGYHIAVHELDLNVYHRVVRQRTEDVKSVWWAHAMCTIFCSLKESSASAGLDLLESLQTAITSEIISHSLFVVCMCLQLVSMALCRRNVGHCTK